MRRAVPLIALLLAGFQEPPPGPPGPSPSQDRPPGPRPRGLADLRRDYEAHVGGVGGFHGGVNMSVTPTDGSSGYSARATFDAWLREDRDHHPELTWTEIRPRDAATNETIRLHLTADEAVYLYPDEVPPVAYRYPLANPANVPFQFYLLFGPRRELGRYFNFTIIHWPADPNDPEDHPGPTPGSAGMAAGQAQNPGHGTEAIWRDYMAEDAWIFSLQARDDDLKEEIPEWCVWLNKDTLLPYRMTLSTATERISLEFDRFETTDAYVADTFEMNLDPPVEVRERH